MNNKQVKKPGYLHKVECTCMDSAYSILDRMVDRVYTEHYKYRCFCGGDKSVR